MKYNALNEYSFVQLAKEVLIILPKDLQLQSLFNASCRLRYQRQSRDLLKYLDPLKIPANVPCFVDLTYVG